MRSGAWWDGIRLRFNALQLDYGTQGEEILHQRSTHSWGYSWHSCYISTYFFFPLYSSLHHPHVTLFLVEQAVVMDQGVEPDLIADIQGLLEDLIKAGLRQRLIALIKVINYHFGSFGIHPHTFMLFSLFFFWIVWLMFYDTLKIVDYTSFLVQDAWVLLHPMWASSLKFVLGDSILALNSKRVAIPFCVTLVINIFLCIKTNMSSSVIFWIFWWTLASDDRVYT